MGNLRFKLCLISVAWPGKKKAVGLIEALNFRIFFAVSLSEELKYTFFYLPDISLGFSHCFSFHFTVATDIECPRTQA